MQIRGVLEGLTAGLTAEVTNEEEIGKLKKYQKQMVHYTKKDDVLAFSEMDTEFYELILNICGKNWLIQIQKNVTDQSNKYRIRSLSILGRLKYFLKEHQEILEALKWRDSEQADKLSQKHIKLDVEAALARTQAK